MEKNPLHTDIQFLPGVGPKRAALLRKELNVNTVGDLIKIYPFRYIDRSRIIRIKDAAPDMAYIQIKAEVAEINLYGPKGTGIDAADIKFNTVKRMGVKVTDGTGYMARVAFVMDPIMRKAGLSGKALMPIICGFGCAGCC